MFTTKRTTCYMASCVILCYFSDKLSPWMTVDTALFVMSAGETKEDSTLVCFTESKDKEVCLCVCVERRTCTVTFAHLQY